jgi:hypothetical protein
MSSFEVQENGTVVGEEPVVSEQRITHLTSILEKIQDPNVPVAEVSRLITVEMTEVLREMHNCRVKGDPFSLNIQKALNDQLKGLRELQKSLSEADVLSKRDVLNFDGPKFQFVLLELVTLFEKALKESGVDDSTKSNVLKQFSDLIKMNDEKIRRETEKITS